MAALKGINRGPAERLLTLRKDHPVPTRETRISGTMTPSTLPRKTVRSLRASKYRCNAVA
jgi:hypothetical protein